MPPPRPSQSGRNTPEQGLEPRSVAEGHTVAATCSVFEAGAVLGESSQQPESRSPAPRSRPGPTRPGMGWGGAPPAYIEVASEIGPTRVFSLSPLPHCEMCNKPSGATRVKINLLASLKFKIINQISAVILRQVARVGHMLSQFLA